MAKDALNKAGFAPSQVEEITNAVNGKSALASLGTEKSISMTGSNMMVFSLEDEAEIVGENQKKSEAEGKINTITVMPVKFVHGIRVSDEFLTASDEYQIGVLDDFAEAFGKKIARGLDISAIHGVNPRTGTASTIVGDNCFDLAVDNEVEATDSADADMESAIALVEAGDFDVTGAAFSTKFRSDLGSETTNDGAKKYPQLAWGANVSDINGLKVETNSTVSFGGSSDLAIVGDFENYFRYGIAKDMGLQVIQFGDPDNSGIDLAGSNQVYIRSEVYVGWTVLVPEAFALIKSV